MKIYWQTHASSVPFYKYKSKPQTLVESAETTNEFRIPRTDPFSALLPSVAATKQSKLSAQPRIGPRHLPAHSSPQPQTWEPWDWMIHRSVPSLHSALHCAISVAWKKVDCGSTRPTAADSRAEVVASHPAEIGGADSPHRGWRAQ